MASLYPNAPQPRPRVVHGRVSAISAGLLNVDTGSGTTLSAPSTQPGYFHENAGAMAIMPDSDGQAPVVIGMSGYATP